MDLVDDVDPLFDPGGGVDGLVPQGPDLVHAVVGGGVQLQHVQKAAVLDAEAGGTGAAGVAVHGTLAVHGLGQDLGAGGLAGAPGAGEEVGVGGPALGHLLSQGLGDVVLTGDVREGLGPPLAVEGLIHGPRLLSRCSPPPAEEKRPFTGPRPYKKSSVCSHGTGTLAAHGTSRLMLLGSPPDMVRGVPLRETGSAAACGGLSSTLRLYYSFRDFATKKCGRNEKRRFTSEKTMV